LRDRDPSSRKRMCVLCTPICISSQGKNKIFD
jgi:hypothetical protein